MKRFKRILLYADPKARIQPALQSAARVARDSQGVVTVVDCLPNESRPGVTPVSGDPHGAELELAPSSFAQRTARTRLDQICEQLHAQGVAATAKILIGQPVREILREVLCNRHDIVMKTAQGDRKRKEKGLFGTTTMALMRKAPCPVWIADPEQFDVPVRILAAVDPSTDDPDRMKLNVQVLDLAAELAESTGARLYVLYAWLALGESLFWTQMPEDSLRKYIEDARRYAERKLANLLARCNNRISPSNVYLVKGDRDEVIADFASQRHIDLIVMGTVGRTGVSGLVIGNTAEKVLRRAHCGVLTIRPDALVIPARADDREQSHTSELYSMTNTLNTNEQASSAISL